MLASSFFLSALLWAFVVDASPAPELAKRQSTITALTATEISSFKPFTFFASAAYCDPSTTRTWKCGAKCDANKDFIPVASGGDGSVTQFWYVGYSPSQKTVIVAHQGTDTKKIVADITDVNLILRPLDPILFPGVGFFVGVHSGFANEQAITAKDILAAVQTTIVAYNATMVTIVGHSLGAALALLDGVYLPLHISGVSFRMIGYGMPRVGNKAFADYVDAHLKSLTHINNKEDPIPTTPGLFLGYHHPYGEVHIKDSGLWVSCPGQDNPSTECIVGDVPFALLDGNQSDHDGPYDGVTMGCHH